MHPHLHKAYSLGSQQALYDFEKNAARERPWGEGSRAGDILTPIVGGLPLVGAPLAGALSQYTTPLESSEVGAQTAQGSVAGQALGGLGGAALGASLGGLTGYLAKKYKPEWELDPERAASVGALLGGGLGMVGGGAYGAHRGRQSAQEEAKIETGADILDQLKDQHMEALVHQQENELQQGTQEQYIADLIQQAREEGLTQGMQQRDQRFR